MAAFEVIALDTATPQLRAPGAGDTYKFPRPAQFEKGTISRVASATTVTSPLGWDSDSYDIYEITALAGNLTISADAGSPINGQKILFRIKDSGSTRTLTWTTGTAKSFREIGTLLPLTTTANKLVYVGAIYNSTDSRWDVIAVGQEL
jgi:hypothetical protein